MTQEIESLTQDAKYFSSILKTLHKEISTVIVGQHKTYANSLIIFRLIYFMELQCGCDIDEICGILLAECKGHKQANFRN